VGGGESGGVWVVWGGGGEGVGRHGCVCVGVGPFKDHRREGLARTFEIWKNEFSPGRRDDPVESKPHGDERGGGGGR